MIAFFDACALIYLIQGKEPFASQARTQLAEATQAYPGIESAVSRLSWLECRVGPMKANDMRTLTLFDGFFVLPDLLWVEMNREVVELAAAIRVRHGLRTPDALQAASCLQLGPKHLFLTGDAMFQRVQGLNVILLT